jgi:hemoglobin
MTTTKHDILTRDDVTLLITEFYTKVRQDTQLAPHFTEVDWVHHVPVITDFWSMILLGEEGYKGNPLAKHLHMPLKKEDFSQWLHLFTKTLDENFTGEKATEAKQRAMNIASIFQFKMGLMTGS